MTRSFEPCLCGDPECKRCFPFRAADPGICPDCNRYIDKCKCPTNDKGEEE